VVIGGGVSAAGDLLLLPAQRAFRHALTGRGFREEARLVLAHFRNDAGLIGAADLARHAMIEPPESAQFAFWPRRRKRRVRKTRQRRESLRTRS
jgi:glucokinase